MEKAIESTSLCGVTWGTTKRIDSSIACLAPETADGGNLTPPYILDG